MLPVIGIWNLIRNLWFSQSPSYVVHTAVRRFCASYRVRIRRRRPRLLYLPLLVVVVVLLLWINWWLAEAGAAAAARHRGAGARVRPAEPRPAHRAARRPPTSCRNWPTPSTSALDRLAAGYEGQRRFAANASHELRTPLAVQRVLTEVAMEDPDASEDLHRLGTQLLRTNERNERLIEGLLVLAESDRGLPGKVPVRLDELARKVLDAHAELAEKHQVSCASSSPRIPSPATRVLLERLITNLVANAISYNEPGGWVEVRSGRSRRSPSATADRTSRPRKCPCSSSRSGGWAPTASATRRRGPRPVDRPLHHRRPPGHHPGLDPPRKAA